MGGCSGGQGVEAGGPFGPRDRVNETDLERPGHAAVHQTVVAMPQDTNSPKVAVKSLS